MAGKQAKSTELIGAKIKVSQTRSTIGRDGRVRSTLAALGLGRIGNSVVVTGSPSTLRMIDRIKAVVSVELSK